MAGPAAERGWWCRARCRDRERALLGCWHGSACSPLCIIIIANWVVASTVVTTAAAAEIGQPEPALDPQAFRSLLPPFFRRATIIEQVADNVWTFTQPLPFVIVDVKLRMTVVKLDDGTLWLHSPVALTGEVLAALMTLGGPVGHIVSGNNFLEHSIFASSYAKAFPGALLYSAVPLEKLHSRVRKGLARVDEVLSDKPPPAWEGQIDQVHFNIDNTLIECVFYHKMSKTLLASDSLLYFDDVDLLSKKKALKPVVSKILGKLEAWDFDKVVAAHGSAPVRDGKSVLWKSFDMPQPLY
eukprot:SM000003S11037  [mRNA]  locus=s3:495764:497502:+ [translate_table: standard]